MAHADRKNAAAKLRELPDDLHAKINAERRRLWHALHEITKQHGGKVVSPPFHSPLRIEIDPQNMSLSAYLRQYGYVPACAGQVSVFDGKGFTKHNIIHVDLPSHQYLAGIAG